MTDNTELLPKRCKHEHAEVKKAEAHWVDVYCPLCKQGWRGYPYEYRTKRCIRKVKCEECGWRSNESEVMRAPNPWDAGGYIEGCPECNSVNSMIYVCDEPECWSEATCGTPTPDGYRRTCGKHMPPL